MLTERLFVVDRIEGSFAVMVDEDGGQMSVDAGRLRTPVREGTVLIVPLDGDGNFLWQSSTVDLVETERRQQEASRILESLKKRDPGGDITL